ncbi:hypothetical protein QTN25_008161 [Entamoeba marina]
MEFSSGMDIDTKSSHIPIDKKFIEKWLKFLSDKRNCDDHAQITLDRSTFLHDYDRLIFSSPFRRLQDKTQVFPLPGSVFVHNRLTHSLEVSSVGRTFGNKLYVKLSEVLNDSNKTLNQTDDLEKLKKRLNDIGTIVAAACLAHDIGNPSFGHSGENAIRNFFIDGGAFTKINNNNKLGGKVLTDFKSFEGNANALRVLVHDFKGANKSFFNLTYATLASMIKYPFASYNKCQKYGYFQSEKGIVENIANDADLYRVAEGHYSRHPFVYLVEAADDICYRVMDIEDAHRLQILSHQQTKQLFYKFFEGSEKTKIENVEKEIGDENEKIAFLRGKVINKLVDTCFNIFWEHMDLIMVGGFNFYAQTVKYDKNIGYFSRKTPNLNIDALRKNALNSLGQNPWNQNALNVLRKNALEEVIADTQKGFLGNIIKNLLEKDNENPPFNVLEVIKSVLEVVLERVISELSEEASKNINGNVNSHTNPVESDKVDQTNHLNTIKNRLKVDQIENSIKNVSNNDKILTTTESFIESSQKMVLEELIKSVLGVDQIIKTLEVIENLQKEVLGKLINSVLGFNQTKTSEVIKSSQEKVSEFIKSSQEKVSEFIKSDSKFDQTKTLEVIKSSQEKVLEFIKSDSGVDQTKTLEVIESLQIMVLEIIENVLKVGQTKTVKEVVESSQEKVLKGIIESVQKMVLEEVIKSSQKKVLELINGQTQTSGGSENLLPINSGTIKSDSGVDQTKTLNEFIKSVQKTISEELIKSAFGVNQEQTLKVIKNYKRKVLEVIENYKRKVLEIVENNSGDQTKTLEVIKSSQEKVLELIKSALGVDQTKTVKEVVEINQKILNKLNESDSKFDQTETVKKVVESSQEKVLELIKSVLGVDQTKTVKEVVESSQEKVLELIKSALKVDQTKTLNGVIENHQKKFLKKLIKSVLKFVQIQNLNVDEQNQASKHIKNVLTNTLKTVKEDKTLITDAKEKLLSNYHKQNGLLYFLPELERNAMGECEKAMKMIYQHSSVVRIEIAGFKILNTLLDEFIKAVIFPDRPFSKMLAPLIPGQFKVDSEDFDLKIQYILDFVSGMTDEYALDLYHTIEGIGLSQYPFPIGGQSGK